MNWMLLPPSANVGRHIDICPITKGDWTALLHAGLRLARQLLAGIHR
jgi:hypothetical protein